jgi:hypothetical protein
MKREANDLLEGHHILPASLGGEGDSRNPNHPNIVMLSFREHYIAHYLLWKIHNNYEMMLAFYLMCCKRSHLVFSSRMYEKLKTETLLKISKPVICLETLMIFPSVYSAAEATNTSRVCIRKSCNHKVESNKKMHYEWYDENIDYSNNSYFGKVKINHSDLPIRNLDDEMIFLNAKAAYSFYNLKANRSIEMCCKKKRKSAFGFHWEYLEEPKIVLNEKYKAKEGSIEFALEEIIDNWYNPIMCVETGKIYKTLEEAKEDVGLANACHISDAIKGKRKTSGGYHWKKIERILH